MMVTVGSRFDRARNGKGLGSRLGYCVLGSESPRSLCRVLGQDTLLSQCLTPPHEYICIIDQA